MRQIHCLIIIKIACGYGGNGYENHYR
jgi:hypothetical protein